MSSVYSLSPATGVAGEGLFVYTCCLSHGEVPGEGMSVECSYICMAKLLH